jgi:23S rRNA pseudouridine2605 synthase
VSNERLQKILARGGIASRRAAEQIITSGRVRVNGKIVSELGAKADPYNDKIELDGKRIIAETAVYVLVHKPRGVVSTMSDPEGRPSVKELLEGVGTRVFPIGRLDFATSGALLATNDGEMADGLMHPRRKVPKTYVCKVAGQMSPNDILKWKKGVQLEDGMTLPAEVKLLRHEAGKSWIELTITEGRNQQIRRMGEATGFPVMRLARLAFAGISTDGLRPGQWRHLTRDELVTLKKTYGVPKSTPHAPSDEAGPQGQVRRTSARKPAPAGAVTTGGHAQEGRGRAAAPRFGVGEPVRRGAWAREIRDDRGGGAPARGGRSQREPERTPSRADAPAPRGDRTGERGERGARGEGRPTGGPRTSGSRTGIGPRTEGGPRRDGGHRTGGHPRAGDAPRTAGDAPRWHTSKPPRRR